MFVAVSQWNAVTNGTSIVICATDYRGDDSYHPDVNATGLIVGYVSCREYTFQFRSFDSLDHARHHGEPSS